MLGSPQSAATLGAAPCAVAWLFRGIAELKARGNARFSVRVSAVEAPAGGRQPLRDLLAAHAHGEYVFQVSLLPMSPPRLPVSAPTRGL